MRFAALATDYDGTLAWDGVVNDTTLDALRRFKASGRTLIMVSGRELDDLERVFQRLDLFDLLVLENGALLYNPGTRESTDLAVPPPPEFARRLRERGVPISVGRTIVATVVPYEAVVLETIRELGLELQVIFNKGSVMVLPSGMNKRAGLEAALKQLKLSLHNAVGVGDAENDHAFLSACEVGVAVANALPMVKATADIVTHGARGDGVRELIEMLLADDLRSVEARLSRHDIPLGTREDGLEVHIPHGSTVLLAGSSGAGKTSLVTGFVERARERGYQFCLIDPEGDYEAIESGITIGDPRRPPTHDEVLQILADPDESVTVNLVGLAFAERPDFFAALFPRLQSLRAKTGRPHWLVVDEAHHLLPESWAPAPGTLPMDLGGLFLVTVTPLHVAPAALQATSVAIAVGDQPATTLRSFAATVELESPAAPEMILERGEALVWLSGEAGGALLVRTIRPKVEHRRHRRKYAEGELPPERSFYFRGPEGALNLRAQNLILFSQLAEGVDDATWDYHLRRGDYSTWFREGIKDPELAALAKLVEQDDTLDAAASRERIGALIRKRYTAPA